MKKIFILILILTTSYGFSQDSQWTYLFDGKTLDGWHNYNNFQEENSWYVKNKFLIMMLFYRLNVHIFHLQLIFIIIGQNGK